MTIQVIVINDDGDVTRAISVETINMANAPIAAAEIIKPQSYLKFYVYSEAKLLISEIPVISTEKK